MNSASGRHPLQWGAGQLAARAVQCWRAGSRPAPLRSPAPQQRQPAHSSRAALPSAWQRQPSSSITSSSSSNASSGAGPALGRRPPLGGSSGGRWRAAAAAAAGPGSLPGGSLGSSAELSLDTDVPPVEVETPELPGWPAAQHRLAALAAGLNAFFRFTRPHTMLGTLVSVCSISLLALGPGDFGSVALRAFLQAVVSALLMNICIVGINQLYDIEIDRVNKPYLPLAAGDFSVATGIAIVAATGAAALAIGVWAGSAPLLATLGGSLALGIAYSTDLPFLRWKRWPVLAAGCILAVRAVLVQLGFYLHMRHALGALRTAGGLAGAISRPVAFATAFMLAFSIVIALFKDIPDVAGDSQAGVRTLSVRLGTRRVYWACIALLEAAYLGAILVGLGCSAAWARAAAVGVHAAMGAFLAWRARQTDTSSSKSIYKMYMVIWRLFFLEYLALQLYRW